MGGLVRVFGVFRVCFWVFKVFGAFRVFRVSRFRGMKGFRGLGIDRKRGSPLRLPQPDHPKTSCEITPSIPPGSLCHSWVTFYIFKGT